MVVGWRATEGHFLKLLKQHLKAQVRIQVVAGGRSAAEEALHQIGSSGISLAGSALDGGFTEYVVSREAERFFARNSVGSDQTPGN